MSAVYAKERLMTVILAPHLSEKSTASADRNRQVVFRVRRDSTKNEIRRAVELLYEVKVSGVQVVNVQGKAKRFGRTPGHRSDWKKAYVCLAEGHDIKFLGSE